MTRKEIMSEIERQEALGRFDCHIDPIPRELTLPVTAEYRYATERKGAERLRYALKRQLLVRPASWYQNRFRLHTRVVGREFLRGLDAAVLVCNHVDKFDCLAVRRAVRGRRLFTVAAPFNNMSGALGELMRAGDMLPLSESLHGLCRFNRAVEDVLLRRRDLLLVYPEGSMWWHYKKPRPHKMGAYSIALRCHVPVLPLFITFRTRKTAPDGIENVGFTVHITRPLYADPSLDRRAAEHDLAARAETAWREIYEQTYGEPLRYTCGEAAL